MSDSTIPKLIHFCWFGGAEKPEIVKKCMRTWATNFPDYEILEWSEENFDFGLSLYVREAFSQKKWAFVSDYVRLYALYNYGGVYVDADVEVLRGFDDFLCLSAFTGFEDYNGALSPVTAVMGAVPHHPWIKRLLDYYDDKCFVSDNFFGAVDLTPNTKVISHIMIEEYGVQMSDRKQVLKDGVHLFPSTTFCNYSDESFSVHHFNGSWVPLHLKIKSYSKKILRSVFYGLFGR